MSVRDEMGDEKEDEQCRQLLQSLKATAEGLLAGHSTNVWSVYGGLQRLHSAVLKILQHGLRIHNSQVGTLTKRKSDLGLSERLIF